MNDRKVYDNIRKTIRHILGASPKFSKKRSARDTRMNNN